MTDAAAPPALPEPHADCIIGLPHCPRCVELKAERDAALPERQQTNNAAASDGEASPRDAKGKDACRTLDLSGSTPDDRSPPADELDARLVGVADQLCDYKAERTEQRKVMASDVREAAAALARARQEIARQDAEMAALVDEVANGDRERNKLAATLYDILRHRAHRTAGCTLCEQALALCEEARALAAPTGRDE